MTMMGLEYLKYKEDVRSNIARESENVRHNTQTETLDRLGLGETVRANQAKESIGWGNLDELVRSNQMRESQNAQSIAENVRHNKAFEFETNRSNRARETIGLDQLSESVRHNLQTENMQEFELAQLVNYQTSSITKDYWKAALDNLSKTAPSYAAITAEHKLNQLSGISGATDKITQGGAAAESWFNTLSKLVKIGGKG